MKTYLDRENYGMIYKFIKSPVWFSVEVDVDPKVVKTVDILRTRVDAVNAYLDSIYEAARAGAAMPEVPDTIKEIINECHAEVHAVRALGKKQKQQGSEAVSSTPSPEA